MPFRAAPRAAGSPSYGLRHLASLFGRAFFDFSHVPLRAALLLGTAAIVLCMGYLIFVLVAYAVGKAIPPGFVSLLFAFAFLSSVNLTMIGVLGVYISRIHEEVRALQAEFDPHGMELVCTGPWPAYNFVPGTIGAAW